MWKGCSRRFLVLRCRVPHAVTRESWGLPRDSQQGHRPQPLTLSEAQHPTAQVQTPQGRALWAIPAPFPSRLRFRAQCVKHRHQQPHVYNQQTEAEAPFGGGGGGGTGLGWCLNPSCSASGGSIGPPRSPGAVWRGSLHP